jgi:hypothetical protein
MMLVSKNGLSFIDLFAIEFEIRREGPLHLTELLKRPLFGPVAGHLEVAFTRDGNLDFVSLFEIESFDNHSGKTHSQTVAPFGNLHKRYTQSIVYLYSVGSNPVGIAGNAQWEFGQIQIGRERVPTPSRRADASRSDEVPRAAQDSAGESVQAEAIVSMTFCFGFEW